jgi:hypothetical protein
MARLGERQGSSLALNMQVSYRRRQLATCRDLKMKVGSYYNFEQATFPTYIYILLENTIALLLAF